MTKEDLKIFMEFIKRLNQLYNMDIISHDTHYEVMCETVNGMIRKYDNGDPLDKVY